VPEFQTRLSSGTAIRLDPAGKVFTGPATSACTGSNSNACNSWLDSEHLRQLVTYQAATRFCPLQWTETALYLVASAGLGWACFWLVRLKRA
jgi:20S proteasome alpha/beta subunit